MSERCVIHLVPHTHWDREWYQPFQTFRMRLVELVDQLLAGMEVDERLRFTLDGQVATIDDYLEVRPEAEPLLRRLIAEGRLAIGPWQILMDEFLVSGETIVRNLRLGWRRAEALGRAMPVGYLPDMFGHVAQMPQILRRAGIERAVVWRGVPAEIDSNVFRWSAPDGSEVEAEYLVGGYGNGAYLFDVPDRLAAKLAGYRTANAAFYGDRSLLAMYGTDHAVPSGRLTDLVEEVNRASDEIEVRIETLGEYAASASAVDRRAPRWTGELRSAARANMLMGVNSARIDLKIACGRVERLLERYAEPLTALHGEAWPARLLELAWRRVVDDSAHDSICGCSRDEVAAQVLVRFAEAEQIGRGIVERTGRRIAAGVPVGSWAVVNPSPGSRTDLVALDVTVGAETEPAFLSAGQRLPAQEIERTEPFLSRARVAGRNVATFLARRRHGRELLGRQINAVEVEPDADPRTLTLHVGHVAEPPELDVDELVEQALAAVGPAPDAEWELRVAGMGLRRMLVRVPVPPLGWIAVAPTVADGPAAALAVSDRVVVRGRAMSNGLVEVVVDGDGTFRLGGAGRELVGVGRIVDGGDFGDSYDYGPPAEDSIVDEPTSVSVRPGARGPLLGGLFVRRSYGWPVGVEPSGAARTSTTVETEVVTYLELRAGEPFVRVAVEFENRSSDHRVRWHIPLPAPAAVSAAEGQYAVVERGLTMEGGHGEVPLPTFPARGFVQVTGVSVLLDHVVEYELVDDGGELALTVLRSFGLISRNDNPYREDPAGPEVPVPAAQLHGPWRLAFALMPHGGDWSEAGVPAAAERYRHDLLALPGTRRGVDHEAGGTQREGLRIEGAGVVMTALTREGDELELRLVAEHRGSTEARVSGSFTAARRVDLLGRDLGPIATERGDLRLPMGPWEIATLRLS